MTPSANAPLNVVMPKEAVLGAVVLCDADGEPIDQGGNDGYETVAASQTKQPLGANGGALGDVISKITIVPASTSPGIVEIYDGTGSAIIIFPGGATSVVDLKPFNIAVNLESKVGPWQMTTGSNVSVIVEGSFT